MPADCKIHSDILYVLSRDSVVAKFDIINQLLKTEEYTRDELMDAIDELEKDCRVFKIGQKEHRYSWYAPEAYYTASIPREVLWKWSRIRDYNEG